MDRFVWGVMRLPRFALYTIWCRALLAMTTPKGRVAIYFKISGINRYFG
jgi:hypothetical protein